MAGLEDLPVDQLVALTRQYEGSHTLLNTLLSNPDTRRDVQLALKKANPKLVIPEIDAAAPVNARMDSLEKENEKMRTEILTDRVSRRLEADRAAIKTKYKLNDADVAEVEKLMTDKDNPIPSYDAAARVHVASKATATPTTHQVKHSVFEMPEKDVWSGGIGNPAKLNRIAMDEAYKAFNEIAAGKVAGLGPAVTT